MPEVIPDRIYDIEDGPLKPDLVRSLFEGENGDTNPRHSVTMTVEGIGQLEMHIEGVDREDGSGESWNFRAYVPSGQTGLDWVQGNYSTLDRKGWLRFPTGN